MSVPFGQIKAVKIYWVYSKRGPDDNRRLIPYQLRDGVLNVPVPGSVARELVARGLCAMEATEVTLPSFQRAPSGEWCSVPALTAGVVSSPPSDVEPVSPAASAGPAAVLPEDEFEKARPKTPAGFVPDLDILPDEAVAKPEDKSAPEPPAKDEKPKARRGRPPKRDK